MSNIPWLSGSCGKIVEEREVIFRKHLKFEGYNYAKINRLHRESVGQERGDDELSV